MVAVGFAALAVGTLIYIFDRSATAVYFVPDSSILASTTPLLFGALGNYLPAFLHTLAFALFANAIAGRHHIGLICIGWFVAEVIFELAQIDTIAFSISGFLPGWIAEWPILENISSHFMTGQFDTLDILFLMLGGVTAYFIGYKTLPQLNKNLRSQRSPSSRPVRLVGLLLVASIGCLSIISSGGTGETMMPVVKEPLALARQQEC
ncbi:MAG: hypothetical protein CL797_08920 [Chromatiales bacterium]|jgi:hypothetical protein|nr:hypothetical protein [Chromatiales bacterium]